MPAGRMGANACSSTAKAARSMAHSFAAGAEATGAWNDGVAVGKVEREIDKLDKILSDDRDLSRTGSRHPPRGWQRSIATGQINECYRKLIAN